MNNMLERTETMRRQAKANSLIKEYSFGSSLTGFIPIPFIDTLGLIGVQRIMIYRLSKIYNVTYSKSLAKIWITTLMSGVAQNAVLPVFKGIVKIIPGFGLITVGTSMAVLGAASTYAVGKIFQQHFEKGGTLENFDPEKATDMFNAELKKGKDLSQSKGKSSSQNT